MGAPVRSWVFRIALSIAALAFVAAMGGLDAPLWVRATAVAGAGAVAAWIAVRFVPAFDPLGRLRWRLPRRGTAKVCAITFDDGPSESTPAVLDILAAERVPATFFVLGTHVQRFPDVVRRAHAEGHAVGLHGMDHAKLAGAPERTIERQVSDATDVLERAGVTPAPVYRTPHGFKSSRVFSVARRRGLTVWAWTRGVWDTDRPAASVLVRRATRLARSGMVLLLHDGRGDELHPDVRPMLSALPAILRELKRQGFVFVRLADV